MRKNTKKTLMNQGGETLKTEINSRDVYWIARGCWNHHFNWKIHPATRADWFTGLVTGASGVGILIIGAIIRTANDVVNMNFFAEHG